MGRLRTKAPALIVNVGLVVSSILFAGVVCELGMRLYMDTEKVLSLDNDEEVFKYRWLSRRRDVRVGEEFSQVNPRIMYSPELGWRPRPNYQSENFTLNSRGVRSTKEYPYEKPMEEQRIVAIGDSFTFGTGVFTKIGEEPVPDESLYTARLEDILPAVSVINLGVDGYGTDQQFLYLQEEGFKYDPDLIIMSIFVDDLFRSTLYFRDYFKPKFELIDGKLQLTHVPVPPVEIAEENLQLKLPRSFVWATVRYVYRRIIHSRQPVGKSAEDRLNLAILDAVRDAVQNHGARLMIVVIPSGSLSRTPDRSETLISQWGIRRGIPVLMLRDEFFALRPEERANLYRGHLTAFGHEVLAQGILSRIQNQKLLN